MLEFSMCTGKKLCCGSIGYSAFKCDCTAGLNEWTCVLLSFIKVQLVMLFDPSCAWNSSWPCMPWQWCSKGEVGSKFCINAIRDNFKNKWNTYMFVLWIVWQLWDGTDFYLLVYQSETGWSLDLVSIFSFRLMAEWMSSALFSYVSGFTQV